MHRLAHDRLRTLLVVILATVRNDTRSKMASRLPLLADQGRAELAGVIADHLDNESSMVIVTEMLGGDYSRRGKWGIDEPVPATVPDILENRP